MVFPQRQGLCDPCQESTMPVVSLSWPIKNSKNHAIPPRLQILSNLEHRGAGGTTTYWVMVRDSASIT